ncbi:hypothetical protein PO124_11640 [Bacillus licheniformis]|nr:hypothetical protein [Bacillus licheniformis]
MQYTTRHCGRFSNGVFAEHIGLLDNLEELIGEAERRESSI